MRTFAPLEVNLRRAHTQLQEFAALLSSRTDLSEGELKSFFSARRDLLGRIGYLNLQAAAVTLFAEELDLDYYRADFAVGDERTGQYLLIEFEAAEDCLFRKTADKAKREWHPKFNQGYNQLVDWFWLLSDREHTKDFQQLFPNFSRFTGLLVIGRDQYLSAQEKQRIDWRRRKCLVDSNALLIVTFDELYTHIKRDLDHHPELVRG